MSTEKEAIPLPMVPEEVTAAWLGTVLGRSIKSLEITRIMHGTASKVFVTAHPADDSSGKTNNEGPLHLCLKGGFDADQRRDWPVVIGWLISETAFFKNVAPALTHLSLPHHHWAGHSASQGQGIVVLDDLSALGCTFGDALRTRTVAEVTAGAEQLASLHAATWHAEEGDYPWLEGQPNYLDFCTAMMVEGVYEYVSADAERPLPEAFRSHERALALTTKYIKSRNMKFRALLHGDAHVGNLYFTAEGEVRFLDWQLHWVGPVFHDVSYLIASSLTVEDRRAHEKEILGRYLDTLQKLGKDRGVPRLSIDDPEVWDEYRKSMMVGVGWFITPYTMQTPDRVHAMIRRYAAAMEDLDVVELIESLP